MKRFTIYIALIVNMVIYSCSSGPKNPGGEMQYFQGNYDEAIVEASQQHKPVFIYGYTTWCGYCKKMESNTFKDKTVSDYMNTKYINLSYDLEKDEGIYIAKKYGLTSYPAYVLLSETGELLNISGGYMNGEKFLSWIKNQSSY